MPPFNERLMNMENVTVNKGMSLLAMISYAAAAYLAFSMIGCAGMGVRAEAYRIDEMQGSQRTFNKPLKCLFINCGNDYAANERSGS